MPVATPGAAPASAVSGLSAQHAQHGVSLRHVASAAGVVGIRTGTTDLERKRLMTSTNASLALVVLAFFVTILAMTRTPIPDVLLAAIAVLVRAIAACLTPSPTR